MERKKYVNCGFFLLTIKAKVLLDNYDYFFLKTVYYNII